MQPRIPQKLRRISRGSVVAIIFKERRYDTGLPKTWLFTHIDRVAIVQGRLHLLREDYGLVCDLPVKAIA